MRTFDIIIKSSNAPPSIMPRTEGKGDWVQAGDALALEKKYLLVRGALESLVGVSKKEDLVSLRASILKDPDVEDEDDRAVALVGIQALLETTDE